MRVVLVHGVGLPGPSLFGKRLEENIRELKLKEEPTIVRVNWHKVVENPWGYNPRQVAALMRGLAGATVRGLRFHLPLRILLVALIPAPLFVWLLIVQLLHAAHDKLVAAPQLVRGAVEMLWTIVAWPWLDVPAELRSELLIYYMSGILCLAVLALACNLCWNGLLAPLRSVVVALVRPLTFVLAAVLHAGVVASLLIATLVVLIIWFYPRDEAISGRFVTCEVVPDAQYEVVPVVPEVTRKLTRVQIALSGIVLAALIGGTLVALMAAWIVAAPLKIVADVACLLGDREYADRLLDRLEHKIHPTKLRPDEELVLVGHSLGSVILLIWLLRTKSLAPDTPVTLITMGSPLKRYVARFFAQTFPRPDEAADVIRNKFRSFKWLNVYRPLDPIGASLFHAGTPYLQDQSSRQWRKILMRAHTNYWDDKTVLNAVHQFFVDRPAAPSEEPLAAHAAELDLDSGWDDAWRGVTFSRGLTRIGQLVAACVLIGLIGLTVANALFRTERSSEQQRTRAQLRQYLETNGTQTRGWLYEYGGSYMILGMGEDSPTLQFHEISIVVFDTPSGAVGKLVPGKMMNTSAVGPASDVHPWRVQVLHAKPWSDLAEQAVVREVGKDTSRVEKRWPITIRYLEDDPSQFDLTDFELSDPLIRDPQQVPTWLRVVGLVIISVLGLCLAAAAAILIGWLAFVLWSDYSGTDRPFV